MLASRLEARVVRATLESELARSLLGFALGPHSGDWPRSRRIVLSSAVASEERRIGTYGDFRSLGIIEIERMERTQEAHSVASVLDEAARSRPLLNT